MTNISKCIHSWVDNGEIHFRVWQQNRDRLVGFQARSVVQTGNGWAYVSTGGGNVQSVLLTTALFHHIYYSYVSCRKLFTCRAIYTFRHMGWFDFDLAVPSCSTVCPILLGKVENCQNWQSMLVARWNN